MSAFNPFVRRAAVCAMLSLVALGAPQLAAAQSNSDYRDSSQSNGGYSNGGYYDNDQSAYEACKSRQTGNAVGGAVVGGVLGAVVGSQVAGPHDRTGGALIGGGGGAIAGAAIGSSSTHCDQAVHAYDQGYDNGSFGQGDDGYGDNGRGDGWTNPTDAGDACDWADSTVYMPDGTTQQHLVHVCRDARGHYEVVN